jgi:hypothetical protein
MKPYGIKSKKAKLGIHDSDVCDCELCNTKGWKKSKKRQRKLIKTELQLEHERQQD